MTETIFALSSGAGRTAIALVRLSGPGCGDIVRALTGRDAPQPRMATRRTLTDPKTGMPIDDVVLLFFAGPNSYTGEDMLELHCHGSKAVTDYLLRLLPTVIPQCRMAEPGEFTRRAFENNKLDLTQAEAVHDLIDAETEAQRAQAVQQMGGALTILYDGWKDRLARLLAYVEAELDFSDEDLPGDMNEKLQAGIQDLQKNITEHLSDNRRGERLRDGIMIAIVGAPNAGKSTLLNALSNRDAAIVSPIAGTTRDIVEVHLDLGGYPVTLADTAGLRETDNEIEKIGVARAMARAGDADLKLALFDVSRAQDAATQSLVDENTIVVFTKSDQANKADLPPGPILISAETGSGLAELLQILTNEVASRYGVKKEAPSLTRARHRAALEECLECLKRSIDTDQLELVAEDLRLAMRALGKITGKVDIEDLLDIIFRDFCIGK